MTRADVVVLEALAKRLERRVERMVRKGYRTDAPKVARSRAEAAAVRRALKEVE